MGMIQQQLDQLYEDTWKRLLTELPADRGISNPLFINVPDGYETAKIKLMIIGKETHSWATELQALDPAVKARQLTDFYKGFCLGKEYVRSPFWQGAHELQRRLEPAVPPFGFVWSNLFLCDQNNTTPENDVADKLRKLSVLQKEIAILQPVAVVFFTGWYPYDYTIKELFPGVKIDPANAGDELISHVLHPSLPPKSFLTYHPKYLRLHRRMDVVEKIANRIKGDKVG